MIRYSKWLARRRVTRRMGLMTPIGLVLVCVLLALPAMASAGAPEMRGEWEIVISSAGMAPAKGVALIRTEANVKGEFATNDLLIEHVIHGTFSGTLEGGKASVEVTSEAYGPFSATKFTSTTMTVESTGGSPSISGTGTFVAGAPPVSATLVATRIKTYKEVEEREEQEIKELEARENVRGEWSLVVKAGPQTSNGTALITSLANIKNEFASSSALFESVVSGTFSGTLEGNKASVEVTSEAYGSLPAAKFTSTTMTVESNGGSLSISGTGTLTSGTTPIPGATLVATRIKTYKEVQEREAKEKIEREAAEKAAREAKEKTEREAREKAAKEKAEREAKEKQEREAREAAERAAIVKTPPAAIVPGLVSIQVTGKSFTVTAPGVLSLQVTNPNPYAISGRVTLLVAQSNQGGKASTPRGGASKKSRSLGTVSFGISPNGGELLKLKLSQTGRTELARHKTLHVLATVVTEAGAQTTVTKTFSLTLHAGKAGPGKH